MRFVVVLALFASCAYPTWGPVGLDEDTPDASTTNHNDAGSDDDGGRAASCDDDHQNGDETDKDCGGSCRKCADSLKCAHDADCLSDNCDGGRCAVALTCTNPCDRLGWECGSGVGSPCGVAITVTCGGCDVTRECIGHACRCALASHITALQQETGAPADEAPAIAATSAACRVVLGLKAATIRTVKFEPDGSQSPGTILMSPNAATVNVHGADIAVVTATGDAFVAAREDGATLRQKLLSQSVWTQGQDVPPEFDSASQSRAALEAKVASDGNGGRWFVVKTGAPPRLELTRLRTMLPADGDFQDRTSSTDRADFTMDLAIDPGSGDPRIAVAPVAGGAVDVAEPEGSRFTFKTVSAFPALSSPRLTYAPDGVGWLVALDSAGTLHFFRRAAGESETWRPAFDSTVVQIDANGFDIAATSDRVVHVVYAVNGAVEYAARFEEGDTWHATALGSGKYPRLAADGAGGVHVVNVDTGAQPGLRYGYFCK